MRKFNFKVFAISVFMFMLGALLIYNVFLLTTKGIHFLSNENIYDGTKDITTQILPASRGTIYDSKNSVLAQDVKVYDIVFRITKRNYANDTDYVSDFEGTAAQIADILGCDKKEILQYLMVKGLDEVEIGNIGRNLSQETYEKIVDLDLPGISFVSHMQRYYPYSNFACHFIGFATYMLDQRQIQGIMGIENTLNEYLTGKDGHYTYYRSSGGTPLIGGDIELINAEKGYDIYLTLNATIQSSLEKCLDSIMNEKHTKVDKAWGIVMDPKTGRILGYGSYPNFDQNTREDITDYNDYCAVLPYEPGSVMKSFIYAACIDTGSFDKHATFNANPFSIGLDEDGNIIRTTAANAIVTINNFAKEKPGVVDFMTAYAHSYNTGTLTLLADYIDEDVYIDYLDKFGFFKYVDTFGIEEGTNPGDRNVDNPIELATTTYGQGSSVTALQMVQAYTAICNDGIMVKPYIIDKIMNSNTNEIVYSSSTTVVGQPIKAETSHQVLELMKNAVDTYATVYKMSNINVGGKTGTADVYTEKGYDGTTIHSIMLTLPVEDPKAIIYVCYQDHNSSRGYFSSYVRELMETVVSVLNINRNGSEAEKTTKTVYQNSMPVLLNHTTDYVYEKLNPFNVETVFIGSGNNVIRQYPESGSTIISGQKIMVLLSKEGVAMPDMTGWSRKEVTAFWDLTGIAVEIDGFGYVWQQNINPGELIGREMQIKVDLK